MKKDAEGYYDDHKEAFEREYGDIKLISKYLEKQITMLDSTLDG